MTKALINKLSVGMLTGTITNIEVYNAVMNMQDREVNKLYWLDQLEDDTNVEYYAPEHFMAHGVLA